GEVRRVGAERGAGGGVEPHHRLRGRRREREEGVAGDGGDEGLVAVVEAEGGVRDGELEAVVRERWDLDDDGPRGEVEDARAVAEDGGDEGARAAGEDADA